jgi:hypothetical protein
VPTFARVRISIRMCHEMSCNSAIVFIRMITRECSEFKGHIDAFLRRMYKYGSCMNIIDYQEIANIYGLSLYLTIRNCNSCINQLLPPEKHGTIALRPRGA